MSKAVNVAMIEGLARELQEVDSCVLVGCRGLTVAEVSELRSTLRAQQFCMRVVKNTLARRSFEQAGLAGLGELLDGPSAVVYGAEGAIAISKVLVDEARRRRDKLTIHGGFSEGELLDRSGIETLSRIPGRRELMSMILSGFFGPADEMGRNMDGLFSEMQGLIEALAEKKEEAGDE